MQAQQQRKRPYCAQPEKDLIKHTIGQARQVHLGCQRGGAAAGGKRLNASAQRIGRFCRSISPPDTMNESAVKWMMPVK